MSHILPTFTHLRQVDLSDPKPRWQRYTNVEAPTGPMKVSKPNPVVPPGAVPLNYPSGKKMRPLSRGSVSPRGCYSDASKLILAQLAEPKTLDELVALGHDRKTLSGRLSSLAMIGAIHWLKTGGWSERGLQMKIWCLPTHPDATQAEPVWDSLGFVSKGPAKKIWDFVRRHKRVIRQELGRECKLSYKQVRHYTDRMEELGLLKGKMVGITMVYECNDNSKTSSSSVRGAAAR